MSKQRNIINSFRFAFNGIKEAFLNEPNFKIHSVVALIVIVLAFVFKFSTIEFAILVLTIFFVLILELVNTYIEKIVDMISPGYSEKAKLIKNLSAAAVCLAAFGAAVIGILLFSRFF